MLRTAHIALLTLPVLLAFPSFAGGQPLVEQQPLPSRVANEGGPRFTTLPPEQTGIDFFNSYDDPRIWGERYEPFAFGSIGTGVAIGDYDGDGRPDIFFAGKAVRGRLYRNLGEWKFEDVTEVAGLAKISPEWEVGAAFVDVDNDGDLDLYVCRSMATNLLYLNQADGTFREAAAAAGLALRDASVMASFGDYNRDGWLDVYVQTNLLDIQQASRGQRDRLYRNRGNGTFEEVTDAARIFGATQGHASIWWDPDEDGWPDLYVGNDFAAPDQLYLNRRDGVFVNVLDAIAPSFPYFAMGMDVADVNNDGRLDLFVADMLPSSREQYVRGMLNMQAKTAMDIPSPAAAQLMRNVLFLNTGTTRFQEGATLAGIAATDWTWSVRFEDLDEDGRVDLHVTNGMFRNFMDADFLARVNQVETAARSRLVRAAPELRERNFAFRNRGDLPFEDVSASWGLDHEGISFGAAFGDLDGDGDLDLVFSNYNGLPTICRNDSAGTRRVIFGLRGHASNRWGIGARLKLETRSGVQTRAIVAARGYLSTSEPVAHFGLGADDRIDRLTVHWPSGRVQVVENLAADHRYVITEPDADGAERPIRITPQFRDISKQATLSIPMSEPVVDEFAQQPLLPARQHGVGPSLAVGDVNGDGLDDVMIGGLVGQPRHVRLQAGLEHVPIDQPVLKNGAEVPDAGMLIFEANGDGRPDLFIAKGGVNRPAADEAYQPRLLLGGAGGQFVDVTADALPHWSVSAGPAITADYDRDGRLDLFIGGRVVPGDYGATPKSALWRNVGGRFVDVTEAVAAGLRQAGRVQAALWTDVDQDGWMDLLVLPHWAPVRCWRNEDGQRFREVTAELGFAAAGAGWWNSIAAADFNSDGTIDYAVGNVGLNTRYRAAPDRPVVLFAGLGEESGRRLLIETETVDGQLRPIHARDSLLAAWPALRRRVPSYHAYAEATVADLFGADQLAAAQRFEVRELRSGVFLSSGGSDAGFVFHPLPQMAQIAPIFGLVADDFDGDGHADLYAVQNSHAPHPEIGRFSGGVSQLLRGNGRGDFDAVDAQESGLVVVGEARALAVKDFDRDGWPDFIVARREAPTIAFLNGGGVGRSGFAVRLAGERSNPTGVGARITVVHESGAKKTAEVYAGSGYMSQSSPAAFFGYTPADPPSEVHVHWPDGRRSRHDWQLGAREMRIAIPTS